MRCCKPLSIPCRDRHGTVIGSAASCRVASREWSLPMSFAEFWPVYVRAHSRPATRVVHLVGTLGLAWVSHFFVEHNMPATFDHPLWSWWADQRMMFLMVTGQMGREVRRYTSPSNRGHRRGAASPRHPFHRTKSGQLIESGPASQGREAVPRSADHSMRTARIRLS